MACKFQILSLSVEKGLLFLQNPWFAGNPTKRTWVKQMEVNLSMDGWGGGYGGGYGDIFS